MVACIWFRFDRSRFELVVEYLRYNLARLVCANVVLSDQYAGNITFVAETGQSIYLGSRDRALVDNGIIYKAIGSVHGDVTVYQSPFLQGGKVVDDDARTSGGDEYPYAFGRRFAQRSAITAETSDLLFL